MNPRRVVITGIGLVSPLGHTIDDVWTNLVNGYSSADTITKFDISRYKTKFACQVKDFDPEVIIDKKEVRKMDLFTQFTLVAADRAIVMSGLELEKINRNRCGVIWASGIGGIKSFEDELFSYASGDGTPRFSPFFIPKMIIDIAAGYVSIRYGFHGVNFATVSACASSSNAIGAAYEHIRYGRQDLVITGGAEASVTESAVGGFSSMKALSERNDDPKAASRPFDKDRDGFVLGEGAAGFILEEYEHALKRGAKIYAEIVGSGYSADAYHITAPHPEGLGAALVMQNALEDADLKPENIDYINVHGTSTPLGDISELLAIKKVFGDHAYKLNISSTKSMHGHLLGAAGALEAAISVLAINNDIVPPTINHFTDDPAIDPKLNLTFNKPQKRGINYALSNTFGFGGHNVSLIFKKYRS
jgi:3-oxoacyl-[acyl-carrier-protein] synthase II